MPVAQASATVQNPTTVRVARLSLAEGDVGITHAISATREQAVANMPLQQGDILSTANGMAQVECDDGATIYLNQNAQLEFTLLAQSASGLQTELTLKKGAAAFSGSLNSSAPFVVSTIPFQVSVPENAEVRVDTLDAEGASAAATQGSATVSTKSGATTLNQGQRVVIHQRALEQRQVVQINGPDDFDEWVGALMGAELLGRKSEINSWPPPVYYGYPDLSVYGTWIDSPGLGLAWRPFASGLNWQPYVNGTWTSEPGLGWTWISYERWGWLPYHYGAWHDGPDGWIWVPPAAAAFHNQWWPARVDWIRYGEQVGWVPMSPTDSGGAPANLEHGIIVPPTDGQPGAAAPNQLKILNAKQLAAAVRLSSPPSTFIASPLPPRPELLAVGVGGYAQSLNSMIYIPYMNPGLPLTYGPLSGLPLVGPPGGLVLIPQFPATAAKPASPVWQLGPGGVRGFGSPAIRPPRVFPLPNLGQPRHYVFPPPVPFAPSRSGAPRPGSTAPRPPSADPAATPATVNPVSHAAKGRSLEFG